MIYRRFGKTNLNLSVFSLGTMRCLQSVIMVEKTLKQAIALGINHVETARGYGKSETYLGISLKNLSVSREKLIITSKVPPTTDSDAMATWIDDSLTRLQVDYLDCLAIHGINTPEHLKAVTAPQGCLKAINKARKDGKVRHLGFSSHGSLELILKAIQTDLFEFVNLHYYYFWQRNEQAIALATAQDLGIFIISPGDKGGKLYNPPNTLKELCAPLTPLTLNYRFLLSDRRITTLSIGAATPEELIDPLRVSDADYPLTLEETAILQRLEAHKAEKLGTDYCRQCYQCLPCPEEINIPEVLRLRNLAVGFDMTDFGQYRYQMFENAGHWFPGVQGHRCTHCGDCLPRCPETLDIPTLLLDTHSRLKGSPRRRLWED